MQLRRSCFQYCYCQLATPPVSRQSVVALTRTVDPRALTEPVCLQTLNPSTLNPSTLEPSYIQLDQERIWHNGDTKYTAMADPLEASLP